MTKQAKVIAPNKETINHAISIIQKIIKEFERNIIGQKLLLNRLLTALLCEGHILLEGVPGLAKTRAIRILSSAIEGSFKRIQFTPDLLPSDISGNLIFNPKDGKYYTKKGPIFANLILADEVNRAPAKVQSALLEAMQEHQVTIGDTTYKLPELFLVLATQNPIEQEGTYPLPEAQVDRFLLKTIVGYPNQEDEIKIMDLVESEISLQVNPVAKVSDILKIQETVRNIFIDPKLKKYISNLTFSTRYPNQFKLEHMRAHIAFGASPRASISFVKASKVQALLSQRNYVIPEDIKSISKDILRHRVILSYEAEAEGITTDSIIDEILKVVQVP